jgi:2-hydroxychromene-2-carboxylate isomerase
MSIFGSNSEAPTPYPAALRMEALAAELGVEVSWRAFLLGPIFNAQGWSDSPLKLYPAKGRYMWRDLERICEAQGIPFRRPPEFPRNGLLAARIACRFSDAPRLSGFVRAVYRANFEEGLDIGAPDVISRCLEIAGEDPAVLIEEAQSPESKERLRAQTQEAARLDIFGAPSFVANGELFWGNDRLGDALSWLLEHPAQ